MRFIYLAALSLLCASVAWAVDHVVFGSVFAAFSAVAVLGATRSALIWANVAAGGIIEGAG